MSLYVVFISTVDTPPPSVPKLPGLPSITSIFLESTARFLGKVVMLNFDHNEVLKTALKLPVDWPAANVPALFQSTNFAPKWVTVKTFLFTGLLSTEFTKIGVRFGSVTMFLQL
jgi:hypothetical protein